MVQELWKRSAARTLALLSLMLAHCSLILEPRYFRAVRPGSDGALIDGAMEDGAMSPDASVEDTLPQDDAVHVADGTVDVDAMIESDVVFDGSLTEAGDTLDATDAIDGGDALDVTHPLDVVDVRDGSSLDAMDASDVSRPDAMRDADVMTDAVTNADVRDVLIDVQPDAALGLPVVIDFTHVDPRYPGRDVPSFADYWWRVEYTMPVARVEDWRTGRCRGGIVMISASVSRCTLDVPVPDGTTIKFYPVFGGNIPVCPRGMPCPTGFMERFIVRYGAAAYDHRALTLDFEFVPLERQFIFRRFP